MNANVKNNILLIFVGALFSVVRSVYEKSEYPFETMSFFLMSWLIHYFAIGLLAAFSYGVVAISYPYFHPNDNKDKILSVERYMTIYLLIAITTLVIALFLYLRRQY